MIDPDRRQALGFPIDGDPSCDSDAIAAVALARPALRRNGSPSFPIAGKRKGPALPPALFTSLSEG